MIKAQSISKKKMRISDTADDYYFDDKGVLIFNILEQENDLMNCMILIHAAIEKVGNMVHGISDREVDEWDNNYTGKLDDPGDDLNAPYHDEHEFAKNIERLICNKYNIDFDGYNKKIRA